MVDDVYYDCEQVERMQQAQGVYSQLHRLEYDYDSSGAIAGRPTNSGVLSGSPSVYLVYVSKT